VCGNWSSPTFFVRLLLLFLCVEEETTFMVIWDPEEDERRGTRRFYQGLASRRAFFLLGWRENSSQTGGRMSGAPFLLLLLLRLLFFFLSLSLTLFSFLLFASLWIVSLRAISVSSTRWRLQVRHTQRTQASAAVVSGVRRGGWRRYIKSEKSNQSNIDLVLPADKKKPKRLSLCAFPPRKKNKSKRRQRERGRGKKRYGEEKKKDEDLTLLFFGKNRIEFLTPKTQES